MYQLGELSILHLQHDPPPSPYRCRCSLPLSWSRGGWGFASLSALDLPQQSVSDEHHNLTRPKADDCPGYARHAEERVYRKYGLRSVHGDPIRQNDEEIEKDFGGNDDRGKEIGEGGDDDQKWREKVEEDALEELDSMPDGCQSDKEGGRCQWQY